MQCQFLVVNSPHKSHLTEFGRLPEPLAQTLCMGQNAHRTIPRNRCFSIRPWFQRLVAPAKSNGLREETSSETTFRILGSTASSDHLPGPFTMRNMTVSICAYSDRISCNTAQNPTCGGAGGRGKGEVPRYKEI